MINDKRIDVRTNEELYKAIQERAAAEGLSISAYIRSVLIKELKIFKNNENKG